MTDGHRLLIVSLLAAALALPSPASALRIPEEHVDGHICDFDQSRILFRDPAGTLKIEDRGTAVVTSIPPVPNLISNCGYLSPHGIVFATAGPNVSDTHVYEFRDGSLIDLGFLNSQFKVVGKWLIWSANSTLRRRDLESGTTVTVSTNAGNIDNDVDENGTVYYWAYPNYQIFRFDGSSTTQLTNDSSHWNTQPLTDGVNAVYSKHTPCCFNDQGSVAFYGSGGETVLDSFRNAWPHPGSDYQPSGGWIAFTRLGAANELQVWVRSPSGTETRISPTGLNASIAAINPDGEVIYTNRPTSAPIGYRLGRPGGVTLDLGTSEGTFVWQDGWYQVAAGTLYRIDPNPDPYPRPKGATPFRASLVPSYQLCTTPNSSHGAPLAFGSCKPPSLSSQYLTLGTPDSNGLPPRSEGSLMLRAKVGNPDTYADEADVRIDFSYTDVFKKDLTDYTGELQPVVVLRRTDRANYFLPSGAVDHVDANRTPIEVTTTTDHGLQDGDNVDVANAALDPCTGSGPYTITVTGNRTFTLDDTEGCGSDMPGGSWSRHGRPDPVPATGSNFAFSFSAPCVATTATNVGSDCTISTTADALHPGLVAEGDRSIWQVASVRVFDGGSDGSAATTADNTLFATEGLFIP